MFLQEGTANRGSVCVACEIIGLIWSDARSNMDKILCLYANVDSTRNRVGRRFGVWTTVVLRTVEPWFVARTPRLHLFEFFVYNLDIKVEGGQYLKMFAALDCRGPCTISA